jgi:hypothetical protein
MANTIYKEKQSFNDASITVLLGIGILGALYAMFAAFIKSTPDYYYIGGCFLIAVTLGGIFYILRRLRMKVSISNKRIKYKLSPLHVKSRKIDWEDVASCEVVKTPKVAQWNGSNISFGGEHFFSLCGRNGLSLTTKNGRRYLIGCDNVDELMESLDSSKLRVG